MSIPLVFSSSAAMKGSWTEFSIGGGKKSHLEYGSNDDAHMSRSELTTNMQTN